MTNVINSTKTSAQHDSFSFDAMLDSFLPQSVAPRGGLVKGTVIASCKNGFWIDFGAKSEGLAPISGAGNASLKIGNTQLFEVVANNDEAVILSAEAGLSWDELRSIQQAKGTAQVIVTRVQRKNGKISGVSVRFNEKVSGFIPFSLLGAGAWEADLLIGQTIETLIEDLNPEIGRAVFNRRSIAEAQKLSYESRRAAFIASTPAGSLLKKVPITCIALNKDGLEYGLFVDVNGFKGLVYKSEIPRRAGTAISALYNGTSFFATGSENSLNPTVWRQAFLPLATV